MSIATYTKSGTKSATPAKLDKKVFGVEVANQELIHKAYLAYLAGRRVSLAKTKKRGEVRGGGKKPHPQKDTGRARFGSSRNPIWRGGGVAFGPTGNENYAMNLSNQTKRQALKQALTLAAKEDKITVIENFASSDGKVKSTLALLKKLGTEAPSILLVVDNKNPLVERSTNNIPGLTLTTANYLNIFDTVNADQIIITKPALQKIGERLGTKS